MDEQKNPPQPAAIFDRKQVLGMQYVTDGEEDYLFKRYDVALPKLQKAADEGNPYAALYLCFIYLIGYPTIPRDEEQARRYWESCHAKLFELASTKKKQCSMSTDDEYFLLLCYYCQNSLKPGRTCIWQSIYNVYLSGLTEHNNVRALNHEGDILIQNADPQLRAQAHHLYHKAAQAGYMEAQYNLAWCYAHGEGGAIQDWEQATIWYEKAAKRR